MKRFFLRKKGVLSVEPQKLPSLALCLLMDFLGYASFSVPFFGEFFDLLWAPISAVIFFMMFGGTKGFFGGLFNFVEEILPGTDFIPTFTITWLLQFYRKNKKAYTFRPSNL